jgi:GNAT superfamily N-acetyltransferase
LTDCAPPKASRITFRVETWSDLERDGQAIFRVHFDELALHKEAMPMGLDSAAYLDMERRGYLLVIAARRDGVLVGYHLWIVLDHHIHNKAAGKVATSDMFYILPEHRRGGAGAKLLMASTTELRKIGVKKASISTKVHFENGGLLDALGWEPTDIVRQILL